MTDISALIEGLKNSDVNKAYQCLKQLESESDLSENVYPFFHIFVDMLSNANSYIRTRALILIAPMPNGILIIKLMKLLTPI